MFEREKAKIKDLSDGMLVSHESYRKAGGFVLRHATLTIQWPHSSENAQNSLTDSLDKFRSWVVARDRVFSTDNPDRSGLAMVVNPINGDILHTMHVDSQGSIDGVIRLDDAYEYLISELEYGRENPDLMIVQESRPKFDS